MTSIPLDDALFDAMETSILPTEEAESLPPLCYTDAAFYAFEKKAIFSKEWLCVGRESWAANPGDYFTSFIADEPLIVARGRDGVLRAMSSVCQHRAMLVAEGSGKARAFVCPYHHWTYALDGTLAAAPAMERSCKFHKEDFNLPVFALEIWEGFVFINFDRDALPLAPRLAKVSEVLRGYDLPNAQGDKPAGEQRYPWNWKVMFENNNDGYHASKLHQGPLHDFIPSELAEFPDDLGEDTAGYYRTNRTLHPDAAFNATQRAVLPVFPDLTADERHRMVFANVPPTLSLVMTVDSVIYLILRADGPESHRVDQGVLTAPRAKADPAYHQKMAMGFLAATEIIDQDLHVDEMVQVGLRSRFAPRGRYSWQEGAQRLFNTWLVPRYRQAWGEVETGKS
ncbi:aromatic ring-hydroxylating oxygenase subunit alpha [Brytella acorum]|uniref:Rieske 2Fe-2S domain-containing protein n=1 Tax=Brytella acorum TaxID=2959299 RepID=A0AA35UNH6_9PROT|nr:SRPBCC family protein [Brytella acorum]MDF3625363.1 SRPBCC family protein [Brytella acorum]CAI9119223.1 Rieske 2Fe-2S domain-containing protein [Brytella acorum]